MAIFSRRTIQRMIDENAAFLTKEQLNQHVSKLNQQDFQSFDTEWEVAALNAFSKLGNVTHEPDLEGSAKLDLLFTRNESSFLADITSVSDEGFEKEFSVKAFYVELQERLKKAGLLFKGWSLTIGELPVNYGEPRKPALPPRSEFAKEIFNSDFKKFLENVNDHPEYSQTYSVSTEKTAISLTYNPGSNSFMSHLPVYNSALAKDKNPVFNALRAKARQHKRVNFTGFKGIILCDGGSDMIHNQPHGAFEFNFNAVDAAKDFLRQYQSIDFVVLLSSVWTDQGRYRPWDEKPARKIQVTVVGNKNFENLDAHLKECLDKLEQQFPEPTNTASGARETIRHGFDPKALRPLAGGIGWSNKEINVSASAVLSLLAGKITQEELFKSLGFKPWDDKPGATRNMFEYFLTQNLRLVEIKIDDTKYDDSTLTFRFDGRDPATSPYTNPKEET